MDFCFQMTVDYLRPAAQGGWNGKTVTFYLGEEEQRDHGRLVIPKPVATGMAAIN